MKPTNSKTGSGGNKENQRPGGSRIAAVVGTGSASKPPQRLRKRPVAEMFSDSESSNYSPTPHSSTRSRPRRRNALWEADELGPGDRRGTLKRTHLELEREMVWHI